MVPVHGLFENRHPLERLGNRLGRIRSIRRFWKFSIEGRVATGALDQLDEARALNLQEGVLGSVDGVLPAFQYVVKVIGIPVAVPLLAHVREGQVLTEDRQVLVEVFNHELREGPSAASHQSDSR